MPRLDLWVRFWVYAVFVAVREDFLIVLKESFSLAMAFEGTSW